MHDFQVALSFAGEQRPLVAAVADRLAAALGRDQVFYDDFHQAELARLNLDEYLQALYHDRSRLVVVFIGKDYADMEWPGLEWRAIRDLIKERAFDRIVLVRVDDASVSGVFGLDGYLDAQRLSPERIADLIVERLRRLEALPPLAKRLPEPSAPSGVTAVPRLPPHFLARSQDLAATKSKLLAGDAARARRRQLRRNSSRSPGEGAQAAWRSSTTKPRSLRRRTSRSSCLASSLSLPPLLVMPPQTSSNLGAGSIESMS